MTARSKVLAALAIAVTSAALGHSEYPADAAPADFSGDPATFLNHGRVLESVDRQMESARQERGGDEQKYLADVHRIAPGLGKSDSQLIADGWKACSYRRSGHESIDLPGVSGPEAAWALTDLCPEVGDF